MFGYDMFKREVPIDISYARLFHASPTAPAVDVYINNKLVSKNLKYGNFTEYFKVAPGTYNIKVFATGDKTMPVLNTNYNIPANSIFTIAAINEPENLGLYVIEDTPMDIPEGNLYFRFVHLSPNAPNVDVRLPDGQNVFRDIGYMEVSDYKLSNPGVYTLNLYPASTEQMVLHVPNINLKENRFYTMYAIGLVGEEPPLKVVIPLDGNSYIYVK